MYIDASDLALERAYVWERQRPNDVYMTQPMGHGTIRDYTWEQALDEARRMAAYLQSYGFAPGAKIAILSKNCAHFVMSDLAIWMAGYVSVALYPTLQAGTVRYILEHSGAKLLFVGKLDAWESMRPGVPDDLPRITYPFNATRDDPTWEDVVRTTAPIAGQPSRTPDETALLVYTSGSTGKPKGVEISFRSIAAAGKGFSSALEITRRERMLSYLPLAHVFERAAIEGVSLYVGCRLFFAQSLDTFLQDIQRARPTLFHSVPRLWLKFQQGVFDKMPEQKLSRLLSLPLIKHLVRRKVLAGLGLAEARLAISGSAPLAPDLLTWYRGLGLELLEGYGMTENFAYSHVTLPGKNRPGYVGNTLPGVSTRISPEGEVLVKSPADMKGYYRDPELTRASYTEQGFLKTGDRGELDNEGRLKLTGRVKELFKTSKGKYVAPTPIENLLMADHHIEMCCVSGASRPRPYALVVLSEQLRAKAKQGTLDRASVEAALGALRDAVNQQVEEHERLAFLVVITDEWQIENGFLTPTLKLKRSVVEDAYADRVDSWDQAGREVVWQS